MHEAKSRLAAGKMIYIPILQVVSFSAYEKCDALFGNKLDVEQLLRVELHDSGFRDNSAKVSAGQIFKLLRPHFDVKCI